MTVKLLVDRPIDGKEYKAGNLCDTDDNTEAGLISSKLAIADLTGGTAYVAPSVQQQIVPVTATTNLTGGIESLIVGANVLHVTNEVYTGSVPFIIPAGDGGGDGLSFVGGGGGAFTLSSAVLVNFIARNAYFYLPDNAGGSGCAAGLYYGEMSSQTAGVIYANRHLPTAETPPIVPESLSTFVGSPAGRITQSTAEITVVQKTVRGLSLGKSGRIEVGFKNIGTATAGVKTTKFKAGTNLLHSFSMVASNNNGDIEAWIRNAGSYSSQISTRTAGTIGVTAPTLNGDLTSVDFSVDQILYFTMQISANTETMYLHPSFIRTTFAP